MKASNAATGRRLATRVVITDTRQVLRAGYVRHLSTVAGIEVVGETPDLLPILAVLGACATSETRLVNAARLRLKESDRLASVSALLRALGSTVTELPDALVITGGQLAGGTVDSCRDHRIAMAAAIASIRCKNEETILGADAVNKSYPAFYQDFNQLGGHADVV